jgi:carbonic anhydrase
VTTRRQSEHDADGQSLTSRRTFLERGVTGAAAVLLGEIDVEVSVPHRELAQSSLTPDQAFARLMDGNARFVANRLTSLNDDLAILKQATVEKQEPFAAVLSCSDSRVPVEFVFDQSIGHLFVARVAGNIASSEIIASLEYGVAALGTKVIMVMGHSACGAVKAAIGGKAAPGQITALYRYIRPAIDQVGPDESAVTKANAQIQAKLLRESSPVMAERVAQGTLRVVASHYELATGKVTILS